jgi:hypothetical protein
MDMAALGYFAKGIKKIFAFTFVAGGHNTLTFNRLITVISERHLQEI